MRGGKFLKLFAGAAAATGVALLAVGSLSTWRGQPENVVVASAGDHEALPKLREPVGGSTRRMVVVLAENDGTETTDFIVPLAMLREAGVAEVRAVASRAGPVELMPALRLLADQTIEAFDREVPEGADIVIVPAMHRQDDPVILDFLRRQADRGALVVSICDGAMTVASAGIFDGRRATGHWYSFDALARSHPGTVWVRNAQIVVDGPVMSTTGVSASIPAALVLIETLADREAAERLAARFDVAHWRRPHNSDAYKLTPGRLWTALSNTVAIWRHEQMEVEIGEGFDEVALALQADAWSRTYRSSLQAVSRTQRPVRSARGVHLLADAPRLGNRRTPMPSATAETALDQTLEAITATYGPSTADFVAVQLEYAWPSRPPVPTE